LGALLSLGDHLYEVHFQMKILLLGSEGMLGSELFSMLKLDHEVVGKDIQD